MIPRTCLEVPHAGALCRVEASAPSDSAAAATAAFAAHVVVEIAVGDKTHELLYSRRDFEFAQRLFAILDTESRGLLDRGTVKEFVTLRCPVFWRRDEDLKRLHLSESDSPTFDEIWNSVVFCSRATGTYSDSCHDGIELGVEAWMVFCRFIALAQYLEGKRRFSARHLQQTMRHRNSPRGSEVVVVDVPPPEPPSPLSAHQLASYEAHARSPLPVPELDLDHSMVAAHDVARRPPPSFGRGYVKVSLFGAPKFSQGLLSGSSASNPNYLEFAILYVRKGESSASSEEALVRRSMADLKWLDDTFAAHKVLGGTLCGRILPPYPPMHGDESVLNTSIKSTSGAITAVAASGVGRIKMAAKSLIGSYLATTSKSGATDEGHKPPPKPHVKSSHRSHVHPEFYHHLDTPSSRAHHIERYLNYLLQHPALSTSFPLNTILKASQSGLEAAKECLDVVARTTKEIRDQTPQLDDGKISIPFWPGTGGGSESGGVPNLAWVRTAAQAAMALKVHGMLETTGMNSASARLQHASLPSLGPASRAAPWEEDDATSQRCLDVPLQSHARGTLTDGDAEGSNFEDGVVTVHSELPVFEPGLGDNGYDLLPLPVPAPERRILSAGNDECEATFLREGRFHYGTGVGPNEVQVDTDDKASRAFVGAIAVEENIGKLREVIGSVENTLARCLASIGGVAKSQNDRQALHVEVVSGLDSWGGMRGKFVSQRSLLKGISGIELCKEVYAEGDACMIDDMSFQNALAKSAVAAAEDVRSAVRVSRTAANAKAAALAAAYAAQNACETSTFSSIDEARAAQTRASIANSHAIHAAVVDHEAKTVMRRSTLALAHDVKVWNMHRKRETLQACVAHARSQHEATRRAVDAWSSLRDGFIGTSAIPSSRGRHSSQQPSSSPATATRAPYFVRESTDQARRPASLELNEVTATIFTDRATEGDGASTESPAIVAVDHHALNSIGGGVAVAADVFHDAPEEPPKDFFDLFDSCSASGPGDSLPPSHDLLIHPFATADPIPEGDEEDGDAVAVGGSSSTGALSSSRSKSQRSPADRDPDASSGSTTHDDGLSASMQSLIDGLMMWGGGGSGPAAGGGGGGGTLGSGIMDTEEDHFALPMGMAASIAFGERTRAPSSASDSTPPLS